MHHRTLTCILLPVFALLAARTEAQSNLNGDRFWIGFMANYNSIGTFKELRVYVAGAPGTTGLVSMPLGAWSQPYAIPAAGSVSINVPLTAMGTVSGLVEGKGVLVESSAPVTVNALNFENNTADGTAILPETDLGTDHRVMSYPGIAGLGVLNSEMMVVGARDSTLVEITPACITSSGQSAGVPFTVVLNEGETYMVSGQSSTDDLTGSRIRVLNPVGCRPIAVFGGSRCTNIPAGCFACDHLYEQMPPLTTWGTRYFLSPFQGPDSYTYRVLADQDSTSIAVDGVQQPMLMAGQYLEVNFASAAACITSDKPVLVAQYIQGQDCSGGYGDPAMVLIPSDDEPTGSVTFSTVSSANLTLHRVNIVTDTANVGSVMLDGTLVMASLFAPFGTCSERAWATLPLTDGIHTLSSAGGFSAIVYGTGINYETYAFSLGSGSEPTADSVICASPGPLVLTAPPGMQLPIWSFADAPNDTLALGPAFTYDAGPSTTILVRDSTSSSTCSPQLRYTIEVNGGGALNVQVYQTSLCPPVTATLVAEAQPALPGISFQWSPATVLPLSPAADSVQVLVPSSTSFQVQATSANGCTLGASSAVVLTYPSPVQPTITQQGDSLLASASAAYTWYLNGSVIPGATDAWFVPSSTGVYGVAVTDQNGCTAVSPPYLYLYTGVDPEEGLSMQAWSGGDGTVHVSCSEAIDRVQVWESIGRMVAQAEPRALRAQLTLHAAGVYMVRVEAGDRQLVRRVVVP